MCKDGPMEVGCAVPLVGKPMTGIARAISVRINSNMGFLSMVFSVKVDMDQ